MVCLLVCVFDCCLLVCTVVYLSFLICYFSFLTVIAAFSVKIKMNILQEEMLNITMGKYRKTQQLLEEAERRADRAGGVNVVRYSSTVIGGGGGGVAGGFGGRGVTRSRAMSVSRDTSTRRMSYY